MSITWFHSSTSQLREIQLALTAIVQRHFNSCLRNQGPEAGMLKSCLLHWDKTSEWPHQHPVGLPLNQAYSLIHCSFILELDSGVRVDRRTSRYVSWECNVTATWRMGIGGQREVCGTYGYPRIAGQKKKMDELRSLKRYGGPWKWNTRDIEATG